MNDVILKLEDTDERLYGKNDINGIWVYYLDQICEKPFNGVVYGTCQSRLDYEAEIKNGYKNGIEVNYHANGSVEQVSECKNNMLYGVSKEFDEKSSLVSVSVVFNNAYLKVVELDGQKQYEIKKYREELYDSLPVEIKKLLDFSAEELITYKFKSNYGLFEQLIKWL